MRPELNDPFPENPLPAGAGIPSRAPLTGWRGNPVPRPRCTNTGWRGNPCPAPHLPAGAGILSRAPLTGWRGNPVPRPRCTNSGSIGPGRAARTIESSRRRASELREINMQADIGSPLVLTCRAVPPVLRTSHESFTYRVLVNVAQLLFKHVF